MLFSASQHMPPVSAPSPTTATTCRVLAAQRVRLGQAVGVGQRGGGVRVLDEVVLALGLARVAGQAAALAELVEAGLPAGDDLVHVRLVAGVEQDAGPWASRRPGAARGSARPRRGWGPRCPPVRETFVDQEVADLGGEDGQLVARSAACRSCGPRSVPSSQAVVGRVTATLMPDESIGRARYSAASARVRAPGPGGSAAEHPVTQHVTGRSTARHVRSGRQQTDALHVLGHREAGRSRAARPAASRSPNVRTSRAKRGRVAGHVRDRPRRRGGDQPGPPRRPAPARGGSSTTRSTGR